MHINPKTNIVELSMLQKRNPGAFNLIQRIWDIGNKEGLAIYIVGGFVRDLLLDRETQDFDIVVEGDAITLSRKLVKQIGGRLISHKKFGTAKWDLPPLKDSSISSHQTDAKNPQEYYPGHIDLIGARKEVYSHPTALPTVEEGDIFSDLSRRDFTINTLAIRLDTHHSGELLDPFEGQKDLRDQKIRILHDRSFEDDPSRQLRAVRFEQRFGFKIEPDTLQLMAKDRNYLGKITGIRLRHELDLMLQEENWQAMFNRMAELGIFPAIQENLNWKRDWAFAIQNALNIQWDSKWGRKPRFGRLDLNLGLAYIVWLTFFKQEERIAIEKRLSFPISISKTADSTDNLHNNISKIEDAITSKISIELNKFSTESIIAFLCLKLDKKKRQLLEQYLSTWQFIKPELNGHDLAKMGIPKGAIYKTILEGLRASRIDGQIDSRDKEKKWVKNFLQRQK
jgi:tRNA nucleotidyltransferase (CCA-adding enzyme)